MGLNEKTYKKMSKEDKLQQIADGHMNTFLSQEEAKELLWILKNCKESQRNLERS